ncbi:hypothetical protein ROS60_001094 [Pluralibacter gergoviae]|nr:hypothetical protein [Pluralibacter gergoviae]ELK5592732.1 hypothetical protein [Pluralibacter gergoviae]MDU4434132.1 hypothetical protein [Pluralibacter gergoviae]
MPGGAIDALLSQRLTERIRTSMTAIFGLPSPGATVVASSIPMLIIQLAGAMLIPPLAIPLSAARSTFIA